MEKATNNLPTVILVGQTPPPTTGQSVMIQVLLDGLKRHLRVEYVRMEFSGSVQEMGKFSFRKVSTLVSLIFQTRFLLRRYPDSVLYYPPAPPALIPLVRDIIFLCSVRSLAKAVIFHYHAYGMGGFLNNRKLLYRLARLAYGRADLSVVPTLSCAEEPEMFFPRRIEAVPYGRDLPFVNGIQEERNDGIYRILFVGILTEGKGIYDLVETVSRLVVLGVRIEVRCVGVWQSSEEKKSVEGMVERNNLQGIIQFCGHLEGDDLWTEYRWADVLFFPTHYLFETQGMVVVEAMAFSLPVVASNWRGPCDVVKDGETGILCDAGCIGDYVDALVRLYKNSGLRKEMGSAGQQHYQSSFTEEKYIRSWFDLICELKKTAT
ncbi:glycosyltransferase family 4 protein [Pontiella sulfatireligans]|uniref:D-inositol 3-phosphate glycosyltransferase n=1 Tax=Pontiella sulfatireligans TaxID=2750658 RepID=A0A6C2UFI4_9BACT|nr:glycosyltransferase family 4 protein [Pontiella sulfatireligans]VGO18287.1 D-inositol 3-phosphate glycosyltransferase [Pontiella sulfatireligans]